MERADDTAFQDRPEAFDGLRMDRAVNVLMHAMVNSLMGITVFREPFVSGRFVDCGSLGTSSWAPLDRSRRAAVL